MRRRSVIRDDLVVGGKIITRQGRLQCLAARTLARLSHDLMSQVQGYAFFENARKEFAVAYRLVAEAKEEQWKAFSSFCESCMKEGKKSKRRRKVV